MELKVFLIMLRALDDTEITHVSCKSQNECDFESDWCGMII